MLKREKEECIVVFAKSDRKRNRDVRERLNAKERRGKRERGERFQIFGILGITAIGEIEIDRV